MSLKLNQYPKRQELPNTLINRLATHQAFTNIKE